MLRVNKVKAQVSLELATAFLCVFILLLASVKMCTWVMSRVVVRQEDYEASRLQAGDADANQNQEVQVDESDLKKYPELHFFE